MTADDLHAELTLHLAYWAHQLGLGAWEFDVRVCRAREMPLANVQGTCRREPEHMRAVIHMLDPIDYPQGSKWPQDHEATLVHEMLHCYHFTPESGTAGELLEEQGIEQTARALVRLRREAAAVKGGGS